MTPRLSSLTPRSAGHIAPRKSCLSAQSVSPDVFTQKCVRERLRLPLLLLERNASSNAPRLLAPAGRCSGHGPVRGAQAAGRRLPRAAGSQESCFSITPTTLCWGREGATPGPEDGNPRQTRLERQRGWGLHGDATEEAWRTVRVGGKLVRWPRASRLVCLSPECGQPLCL